VYLIGSRADIVFFGENCKMESKNYLIPNVLILCGGLGTRFRPVRDDIPKVLAPIRGRPFLDWIFDELLKQGIRRVVLATGYLADHIASHVAKRRDIECILSHETEPLGTGGAIKQAQSYLTSELTLVFNGDSYVHLSLQALLDFHQHHKADMTMALSSVTKGKDYGKVIVDINQRVIGFIEKKTESDDKLINAGVYCFSKKVIINMPFNQYFSLEKDWIPSNLNFYMISGMTIEQPVYDIGTRERYMVLQNHLHFR